MKRNLLKTMLCAVVAALPVGAWAQEEVVSEATTWTFDDYTVNNTDKNETQNLSVKNKLYNRSASSGRGFYFDDITAQELHFTDALQTSVTVTRVAKSKAFNNSNMISKTAGANDNETTPFFAFNTSVSGTCYALVKSDGSNQIRIFWGKGDGTTTIQSVNTTANSVTEIKLQAEAGVFFIGGAKNLEEGDAAREIYAIRFVPDVTVSEETTWTFGDFNTTTFTSGSVYNLQNGLYARAKGRSLAIAEQTDCSSWTFDDGYTVPSISKCITLGNLNNGTAGTYEPYENSTYKDGTVAFKVTVPGKVYVVASGSDATKQIRIQQYSPSTIEHHKNITTTASEYSVNVAAGTVYIGATIADAKVYAIRFVPTSVSENTTVVYIGATGYATFANNGVDIPTLPEGFSAYAATASEDGHSVVLSPRTGMRRTNGYVVKGTPNTNYRLTYSGEALGSEYNGGEMKRAQAAGDASGNGYKINQTSEVTESGATVTKNNYILGADGGSAKFFKPENGSVLAKTKAFLQTKNLTPADPGAPGFNLIIVDNNVTGINEVKGSEFKVQGDGAYYNLNGQRVAQPTKGLYIVNGKKVVIK